MLKYAVLAATLIGGAHAQFDCAAAGPKTAQDLINAGFGVGTVHAKTSGGCGGPPNYVAKATFYRVMEHVDVGGGDYRFHLEYCTNGGTQAACGHEITDPAAWTCVTTGTPGTGVITANLYHQGDPNVNPPVKYCLGQAQEKEVEGLAHSDSHCTADANGACADSAGNKYNCLVQGLEVCAAPGAPPALHDCSTANCGANATCADVGGGGGHTCTCNAGYTGTQTTNEPASCVDTDECAPNPCQNGGTCADGVNSFTCTCAAGYSGATCETNIDECSTNPCDATGTASCTDGVNTRTCNCKAGYSGTDCQTNIDECATNPCLNGGTCIDGVNSFTCTCAAGWSGATCETNINYCTTSAPTTIYVGEGTYLEASPPHFDFYKDQDCTSDKLVLKGGSNDTYTLFANTEYTFKSCTVRSLSYQHPMKVFLEGASEEGDMVSGTTYRTIQMGAIGTRAEYKNANPNAGHFDGYFEAVAFAHGCQNGAGCVDGQTGYTCNCATGYEGTYCETDTDECAGGTPAGIGQCVADNTWECKESSDAGSGVDLGDYWCDCKGAWTGKNCDVDPDECAGGTPAGIGPCVAANSDSCTQAVAPTTGFTCNCKPGYEGQTCADDVNECAGDPCGNANQVQECQESNSHPGSVNVATYNCVCKAGWSKDPSTGHCTVDVDECAANPCQHGATCTESGTTNPSVNVLINDYHCACTAGWKDKDCAVSMDDCLRVKSNPAKTCDEAGIPSNDPDCANPCVHSSIALGGKCEDGGSLGHKDYTCTCEIDAGETASGWMGKDCDTSVDDCASDPCKHGASCTDAHYGHTCNCAQTSPLHYNDPAKNEVNCDTLVVQGCMDPKKFNYDPNANHDNDPPNPCTGGFDDWYDAAKNGGVSYRKGRVKKFTEMQDRKAKVARHDGKDHGIKAQRIEIRKLDRIKIKLEDFKPSVRTKPVFNDKSLKMEVGPVNKPGAPDAEVENCAAKAADYKSGDESCITTMLDEEEQDGNKMTLTRRVVPCVGCWQVAGKTVGNKSMPIFKQTKTHEGAENNDNDNDKYTMSCWDEPSKTWEQETTDVEEGADFQCEKTRHRVIVGGLTNNPAACEGVGVVGGCTGEQLSEAYRNRGSDCAGQTADASFSRSIVAAEANTGDCKTLGCTKEAIVSAFTCS